MSMVIGKEAREALGATLDNVHRLRAQEVYSILQRILNRCTDAPEVGGAEPVAFISHTREGDIFGRDKQFDAPRVTPLYAHPPEVGLPEGWVAVPVEPTPKMRMAGAPTMNNMGPQYAEACYRAMIAAAPKGLESAGQKEGGE